MADVGLVVGTWIIALATCVLACITWWQLKKQLRIDLYLELRKDFDSRLISARKRLAQQFLDKTAHGDIKETVLDGLSKECSGALQRLAREPDDNWWKEVLANKDLLLAVRGGYLNAYVKGQSVFKIGPRVVGGKPRVEIHYKYLVAPELEEGNQYIQFNGSAFSIDPTRVIQQIYKPGLTLKRLVRTASRFGGAEKTGVHRIAANEPRVVDVEIAFTRNGDPGEKPTAPRMDVAVLIPNDSKGARLVFCEAKCADNDELWKLEGSRRWVGRN
jgi:hypothetical protein